MRSHIKWYMIILTISGVTPLHLGDHHVQPAPLAMPLPLTADIFTLFQCFNALLSIIFFTLCSFAHTTHCFICPCCLLTLLAGVTLLWFCQWCVIQRYNVWNLRVTCLRCYALEVHDCLALLKVLPKKGMLAVTDSCPRFFCWSGSISRGNGRNRSMN